MKKTTLLFLVTFIFAPIFLQAENHRLNNQYSKQFNTDVILTDARPDSAITFGVEGEPRYKDQYKYDSEGNVIHQAIFSDYFEAKWDSAFYQEISKLYDDEGRDTLEIAYAMMGSGIPNELIFGFSYKKVKKYDESGILLQELGYSEDNILESTLNIETNFDNGMIRFQTFKSEWSEGNSIYAFQYEYNDSEMIQTFCKWDESNELWEESERYIYKYNNEGLLTEKLQEQKIAGTWERGYKEVVLYDVKNKPVRLDAFGRNGNLSSYKIYYYSNYSGIEKTEASHIKIWADGQQIYVESESEISSLMIYDITGNLLYQNSSLGSTFVFSETIRKGTCLVQVKDINGKSKTEKVLIR
jgi:hypothetical protein